MSLNDNLVKLRQAVNAAQVNVSDITSQLSTIKKQLILAGVYGQPANLQASIDTSLLVAARDAFELGCLACIRCGDIEDLERNYTLLRPYYHSSIAETLPPSAHRLENIYLYLLSCLSLNPPALANFFSELELLSPEERNDPLITAALKVEQAFETGSYAVSSCKQLPLPHLSSVFANQLELSSRSSAASSIEASYDEISLKRLAMLLGTQDNNILQDIILERGWNVVDTPAGKAIRFDPKETGISTAEVNKETIDVLVSIANSLEHVM